MEIEESIKLLKNYVNADRMMRTPNKEDWSDYDEFCENKNTAIDTVIAELFAMQNLLDEKNEELDRLQKENEDKKTYEFGLVVGTKREREYWENKIRKEIKKREQKLAEYRTTFEEFFDEEIEYHNNLHNMQSKIIMLENLLKEE